MGNARTAGLLYLIVILTGMFSLAYVPARIDLGGDAASALDNLRAAEPLLRLGIAASLICYTAFLLLPLALYRLLAPVHRTAAVLMVAFAVASVPIAYANTLNKLQVLTLLGQAEYLHAFTQEQLHAQVMLAWDAYGNGLLLLKVFWGLWLLPFGYLVFKSRRLPRVLGLLLMAGCLGYLLDFLGRLLLPAYPGLGIGGLIRLPAALGEIGTGLWLLIFGARNK